MLQRAELDGYLRYGLHHSAALRAEFERWRAALERIPKVTSLPDPVVGFAQFIEEVQTRTGPQERRYGVSQTFPWFGKLHWRGQVADAAAEAAWHKVEGTRLEVARDIALAYFDYAYLAQSRRITEQSLDRLRRIEPLVQSRITGGTAGQGDLLRLQVEVGRLENERASLEYVRPALSAKLAAAMHWQGEQVLPLPELTEPEVEAVVTEDLLARAEHANPAILRLHQVAKRSRSALELAQAEVWPDVTVGVDYIETGDALAPVAGSGDDPWALRVMFDLPLWGRKYAALETEAQRELSAANHDLMAARLDLRAKVQRAVFALEDSGRQVVLYRDSLLPRAGEAVAVVRASYRAGGASLLDVIDSERAWLDFEIGYWRACRDYHKARAELDALLGGDER